MKITRILAIGIMGLVLGWAGAPNAYGDFIQIPGSAFTVNPGTGMVMTGPYVYKSISAGYLNAPVFLPDGVIIKSIRIFYYDNSSEYINVHLYRRNQFNDAYNCLFYIQTSGAIDGDRSMVDSTCEPAPSYRKVYNNACQYYLRVYFGAVGDDLRIYGVSIEYL